MKRIFDRQQMREYWQTMFHSVHNKISRGAEYIRNMVSWGRGEHWRRKEKKK